MGAGFCCGTLGETNGAVVICGLSMDESGTTQKVKRDENGPEGGICAGGEEEEVEEEEEEEETGHTESDRERECEKREG